MGLKDILKIGVATEKNNYEEDSEDKVWIRNEEGKLILMGGEHHEDAEEQE